MRELALMHIVVTSCATELSEVISNYFGANRGLVALDTCNCHVTTGQWEAGLLVHRERVAGGFERLPVVALFASVVPGGSGELSFVFVHVAIDAKREFDFEACVVSGRYMAGGALHRSVRKRQRESSLRMVYY